MSLGNKIDFIVKAGGTVRFHTWPTIKTQTVAEHSWRVAMLVNVIAPSFGMPVIAALEHDMAECVVGDIPSPAKRSGRFDREAWDIIEYEVLKDAGYGLVNQYLTSEDKRVLKLADYAEGCLFCIDERNLGNRRIAEVYANFRTYLKEFVHPHHILEEELVEYIDRKWREANGQ